MSKIEVNTIEPQCGTTVTVGKCTSTVAVPGNVIKSNAVQASDGGNIVSQSGTDITLGASGDTINLASGASQSGFGRTGTVDWDTSIHTGTVTAATGKGYFVNTTSGGITVNLPAGVVGSIVAVSDYASTAASNNITISPNGSEKINAVNDDYIINTAGLAVTLVYADATRGWKSVTGSDADATGQVDAYIVATGGTPCSGAIVCTNYKVHTFTGPGTFCVSTGSGPLAQADYLVVAGGGGGGHICGGGGGGAGGYRESPGTASGCYSVSPLGTAPAVALTLSVQGYPITVGGGGAVGCSPQSGCNGSNSIFSSITSAGGGGAGGGNAPAPTGGAQDGGSGGGGGGRGTQGSHPAGSGNTPSVSPAQGFDGGTATPSSSPPTIDAGGGGGGALAVGVAGSNNCGGSGGGGATSNITNTPTARAGGGGGGAESGSGGAAGPGGGGAGVAGPGGSAGCGTVNTGGGGGGKGSGVTGGGAGGSGVVVIRYKFQ
jgi:hypothetical protein